MNFEFPPIYNFPPFFTRQLHEPTWLRQCQSWRNLILEFAAKERLFELELSNETISLPLFSNSTINRKLSVDTLKAILDSLVVNGQAEWIIPGKVKANNKPSQDIMVPRCLLFWKLPSEWADLIYTHVKDTGQIGSIITVYELFQADEASSKDFYQLPEALWRRSISILEKSGKARLFDSDETVNPTELGIKFF